ncbi:MAG: hypothetical protein JW834_02740 [Candidatus Diapherotrites archaeon]|nr:hypothetical protein [Candidatus Diapherotrites archaeon]
MVSKNGLLVVSAILVVSLAVPLASMLTESAAPEAEEPVSSDAPPAVLIQIEEFSAVSSGTVLSVQPVLITTATSDLGAQALREAIASLPGVQNVSLQQSENPGSEGLYKYDVTVTTASQADNERVSFLLTSLVSGADFLPPASPAVIGLPKVLEARNGRGSTEFIEFENNVTTGYVYGFTHVGDEQLFNLEIQRSGGRIAVMAVEAVRPYSPSVEEHEAVVAARIVEVTGEGVERHLPFGEGVDTKALFDQYGVGVAFDEGLPFFTVSADDVGSVRSVLVENNVSFSESSGLLLVSSGDYSISFIKSLLPEASVEEPHGTLWVEGSPLPSGLPGVLVREYDMATITLPEVVLADGIAFNLSGGNILARQRVPKGAAGELNVTAVFKTAFGVVVSIETR